MYRVAENLVVYRSVRYGRRSSVNGSRDYMMLNDYKTTVKESHKVERWEWGDEVEERVYECD